MKKTIFYQAVTQFENTGDLIINKSLIDLIRPHGDLIINDKGVPKAYLDQLGVGRNELLSTKTRNTFVLYLVKNSILSMFQKNKRIYLFSGPGHFYGTSKRRVLYTIVAGFIFMMLNLFGCKIVKVGSSMGPLSRLLLRAESFRAKFIDCYFLRDSKSIELAKSGGIQHANFFPDLAWALKPTIRSTSDISKDTILFSFRSSTHSMSSNNQAYQEKLFQLVDRISNTLVNENSNYKILVSYQVEHDYSFCKEVFSLLKGRYNVSFIEEMITTSNAESIYRGVKYIFSNRLHVLLYGYKFGALPIPMIDSKEHLKITGIFEDAKLGKLILDINNLNMDLFLDDLIKNSLIKYNRLVNVEKKYTLESEQLMTEIFN